MKRFLFYVPVFFVIFALMLLGPKLTHAQPQEQPEPDSEVIHDVIAEETEQTYVKGTVLEVKEIKNSQSENLIIPKSLNTKVKVTEGRFKDKVLKIRHDFSGNLAYDFDIKKHDKVVLLLNTKDNQIVQANIANLARDTDLIYLFVLFLFVILVIGQMKGLKAIITLLVTVLAVLKFLLPSILKGSDPVWSTILVAAAVTAFTMFVVGGLNTKSLAAILGTIGGVILTGIIAKVVIGSARLSGLSSEESTMLLYIPQQTHFDFQGLLFAGIIIGALGAVMDVGMSISSAIWEIHAANPALTRWQLTKSGLNVGKDIMGTMSNTLILAYTGGSLPLLLLITAYNDPLLKVVNLDMIATEIVRAFAGSIGLFLAIPLTALCAGYLVKLKAPKSDSETP